MFICGLFPRFCANGNDKRGTAGYKLHLAQKGFVAAIVEYRLSHEAKYPAAVDDLHDAVLWLYHHADEYKIDKNKIAVSGCSAGEQLAALIGAKNKDKLIKAVINIDGISTFIEPETINRAKKTCFLSWPTMETICSCCIYSMRFG
jgi:acetyl esterase/lipase